MSVLNCWNNVVGITRTQGECYENIYEPQEMIDSLSGLYLDEAEGINLNLINDTGGDLFEKVEKSYENAIRTFQMDVMAELLKHNKKKYDSFVGNIGSQRFRNNLTLNKDFAGVRIYCNDIKGAYFKLNAIGLCLNTTASFDIYIYNNIQADPLYQFTVDSTANKYKINNLLNAIELPLSDDNCDNLQYYVIYERNGMQAKDNQVTCGCGGVTWCFNTINPCFADSRATKDRWRQFVMIGRIQGNDTSTFMQLNEGWTLSSYMNGLVLIGEFTCDNSLYLCNSKSDWENDLVDKAIAYSILFKWAEFTMDYFLSTSEVSRYTMLGIEAINFLRGKYNLKYAEMINFIIENIDISKFGCLRCKPAQGASLKHQSL